MASKELSILVTAKDRASGTLHKVRGEVKGLSSEAKRGAAEASRNIGRIALGAAAVVGANVAIGVQSLEELARVTNQTEAVLKSTGGAAGVTAAQVRKLAQAYEDLTTIDDKAIQNTENLLLTFTNIKGKAFEPALQAVLDMNAAMGGDEESLKNVAIQVGKALQDPILGATALRRVGVNLTKQQQDQIKTLVEQNKLYDAQQIVLKELQKEFSGSAAALAKGPGGDIRRFKDAIEDAQMALATGFLPLITSLSKKTKELLSRPEVIAKIKEFGAGLSGTVDKLINAASRLPWGAIGDAFRAMGTGAKAALDLFLSAPAWLQTAVLTGWGLNKLTGGALGNITIDLAMGGIKGLAGGLFNRGSTPVNPLFVKDVGGGLGGGIPGGGGEGGGSLLGKAVRFVLPIAAGVVIANAVREAAGLTPEESAARQSRGQFGPRTSGQHLPAENPLTVLGGGAEVGKRTAGMAAQSAAQAAATSTAQTLANLGFTPNMGPKDRKAILEQGKRTGTDPFGEQALSVFRQAANPKDAKVLGEIKRHITELRDIEKTYLSRGQVQAAQHTQETIGKLEKLIGVTSTEDAKSQQKIDQLKAQQNQHATQNAARTMAMLAASRTAASATASLKPHLARIEGADAATSTNTAAISRKNFSPHVTTNVSVNARFNVSVKDVVRSTSDFHIASGQRGGLIQ